MYVFCDNDMFGFVIRDALPTYPHFRRSNNWRVA
jgi:hypothetical protein